MQMMGVAQGMPLFLDLKTETGIKNRRYLFDSIFTTPESSLMKKLYGSYAIRGFKLHHQGIRVPYVKEHSEDFKNVRLTAFSHDQRIAEALEYSHRPALGVQFHPEMSFSQATRPVFKWFLSRACENKKQI
jgi:gamma-glutamyl-gamma-aminobutyrate hydrolase PuuD